MQDNGANSKMSSGVPGFNDCPLACKPQGQNVCTQERNLAHDQWESYQISPPQQVNKKLPSSFVQQAV
jgi:hypothetical protein